MKILDDSCQSLELWYKVFHILWRRSQVAKAVVCKTIIQRFDSARRLQFRRDYEEYFVIPFFRLMFYILQTHSVKAPAECFLSNITSTYLFLPASYYRTNQTNCLVSA